MKKIHAFFLKIKKSLTFIIVGIVLILGLITGATYFFIFKDLPSAA